MTFEKEIEITHEVIDRFEKIEGKPWNVEGSMIELSKQVGELSKLVLMNK